MFVCCWNAFLRLGLLAGIEAIIFKKELICVDPPSHCLIHLSCCCHENLPTQGVALKYSWGKTGVVLVIP